MVAPSGAACPAVTGGAPDLLLACGGLRRAYTLHVLCLLPGDRPAAGGVHPQLEPRVGVDLVKYSQALSSALQSSRTVPHWRSLRYGPHFRQAMPLVRRPSARRFSPPRRACSRSAHQSCASRLRPVAFDPRRRRHASALPAARHRGCGSPKAGHVPRHTDSGQARAWQLVQVNRAPPADDRGVGQGRTPARRRRSEISDGDDRPFGSRADVDASAHGSRFARSCGDSIFLRKEPRR